MNRSSANSLNGPADPITFSKRFLVTEARKVRSQIGLAGRASSCGCASGRF